MKTMGGSDISGGCPMGSLKDVSSMSRGLPMPPQPAMVHGTGMAGSQKMGLDALTKMTQIK